MTSYPDFLCVGAQKAATTWLYDVLNRTPGVFLPKIKELHYFSQHYAVDAKRFGPRHRAEQLVHARSYHQGQNQGTDHQQAVLAQLDHIAKDEMTDDWYREIFSFAHDGEICAEVCPCYMHLPVRGVRHVLNINPLMRVLVLVRDPIDRIWSHMRMHVNTGHVDLKSQAVASGECEVGPYMRYTDYAATLPRWESMCAHGRLKLIAYDRIGEHPEAVYQEIMSFIGMPGAQTKADLSQNVFSGSPVDLPRDLRAMLLEKLTPQYEFLRPHFPSEVEAWLARHHAALELPQPAHTSS